MSLSVIIEEPSGFQEGDLEFVGRVSHQPKNRHRPKTYGGRSQDPQRYGSPSGRYIRGHAGRSLGGLRVNSQSYSPNSPGPGPSRTSPPKVVPIRFARNPRHPKSLYDAEKSMRNFVRGRQPKVTPDLAFPDPKTSGAFRNPVAPRFHYDYDPAEEDYNIQRNPLAGIDSTALLTVGGAFSPVDNRGFTDTGDGDSDENSSDSDDNDRSMSTADGDEGSTVGDSVSVDVPSARRDGDGTAVYSTVQKYRAPVPPPPVAPPPVKSPSRTPRGAPVPVVVLPRAVAHHEPVMPLPQPPPVEEELPPPLPAPLQSLAEEDESQDDDDINEELPKEPQDLRDMSTQTTVTVQSITEPVDEQDEESEDRFVQITDGRADSETMTHNNWEVVAPWTDQRSAVERSNSLAVNYRRVVAELSGSETQPSPPRQRPQEQRPPSPPPNSPPRSRGEPPPWSPPIVPQRDQILRPMRMVEMMDDRRSSGDWDYGRRRRGGTPFAGFWNRCCLITLMLLALVIIICAALITVLYASFAGNCTSNCGLVQQPGYLAGFVALGALAILTVLGLVTWCCYNITRRQHMYKYRTRERP